MPRVSRQSIVCPGAALVAALMSLAMANAQGASDRPPPPDWDQVFAQVIGDQTAVRKQSEWRDLAPLGYAKAQRSDAAVQWLPQQLPAGDGINRKNARFGGGGDPYNG